ncbi:MAG: hypothetical protein EXR83_04075 [Gammaproteobacteria bacterium]|nr:hypothetical protein [Gammaproteobacteria bacterium]
MSTPQTAAKLSTAELVARYLTEHLQAPADEASILTAPSAAHLESVPTLIRAIGFLVGPFRFLCRADALLTGAPSTPCAVVIEAAELVPAPYRAQLGEGQGLARDVVWLRGGRLEIRGCRLEGAREIHPAALIPRGPRAAAPWIGATLRDPPAFVLDPDATQLHFMRRL